jgi:thiamine-phosphate pyrophosphorylase
MASVFDRERLARSAKALNEASGARDLPPLILMTDDTRLVDPLAAARVLPRRSAVIVRHTDAAARGRLALSLAGVARERGLVLLIAADARLAADTDADGLHLPEVRTREAAHWRALRPSWLITAAAHSLRGLMIASRAGADAALLGTAFATRSHPGRQPLGVFKLRTMAAQACIPIYALGGINAQAAGRLSDAQLAGIAAIEGLLPDQSV